MSRHLGTGIRLLEASLVILMLMSVSSRLLEPVYMNIANIRLIKLLRNYGDIRLAVRESIVGRDWEAVEPLFDGARQWANTSNESARIAANKARFLYLTGHWIESGEVLGAANQNVSPQLLRQGDPMAFLAEAVAATQRGSRETAARDCQYALALASGQSVDALSNEAARALTQFCGAQTSDNPFLYYWVGELFRARGQHLLAARAYQQALDTPSFQAQMPRLAAKASVFVGQEAETHEDLASAVRFYELAVSLDPRRVDAVERLIGLYGRTGGENAARLEQLEVWPWPEPTYVLNQRVGAWVLFGFDLDEEAVSLGGQVDLTTYWYPNGSGSPPPTPKDSGWYTHDNLWVRFEDGLNWVRNAGFEHDSIRDGYPFGYGGLYPCENPNDHVITSMVRQGERTQVAGLLNTARCGEVSLVTGKFSVEPGQVYLLSAWINSGPDTNAGLGILCSGPERGFTDMAAQWVGGTVPARGWNRFSKAYLVPTGMQGCSVIVHNYQSLHSTAYFDNLLFVQLSSPEASR